MPKSYQLTSNAKYDLIKIRQYTLQHWGTEQSIKYLAKLRQAIELLAENTSIGKLRPEVVKNVYSFAHASHIVYYKLVRKKVIVFSVLHKSMIPIKHLPNEKN